MEKKIEIEKFGFLVLLSSHWRGSNGSFKQKTHCLLWFVSCKSTKINIAHFCKKGENKQGYPRVSWEWGGERRIRVNIFFWNVPCNLPGPWYNWVGVGEGNIISNNPFRGVHRIRCLPTSPPQKKIRGPCSEGSFIKNLLAEKNSRKQNLFGLLFWSFSF